MGDKYWNSYGPRPDVFWEGVIEGIRAYAKWKNGSMVVGMMEESFADVISEIQQVADSNPFPPSPIEKAAFEYLKETEQLPYNLDGSNEELVEAKVQEQVRFIQDNALAILRQHGASTTSEKDAGGDTDGQHS